MTGETTGDDDPRHGDAVEERGEELAAWLEGLGLVAQLAEEGLPTFSRDADGRATWTDPHTGSPLTQEQLEQLERLLRSEGSEPEHAVPLALVQAARRARLREQLLAGRWLGYGELARLRGTSVDAARFWVHKSASEHRLLVVAAGADTVVPAFQLTADGEPRADLAPVLEVLLSAGMEPWSAWIWLTQPASLLGGQVPERAVADPAETDLVHHAARRLAERVAATD